MKRYQVTAYDAQGYVVHAGGHDARRFGKATAERLQREWLQWRDAYLAEHPGDTPLRETATNPARRVVRIYAHVIGTDGPYSIYEV